MSEGHHRQEYSFKPRIITSSRYRNASNNNDLPSNSVGDKPSQGANAKHDEEDMKISKLLRRLNSETKTSVALDLCEKLKKVIADPSNATYVKRSFDILADSIIAVFENGPIDALDKVAEVFGLMGWVLRNDFPSYKAWIVKVYKNNKQLRIYMMKSLTATLEFDTKTLTITSFSNRLIELLKDFLEQTDIAKVFLSIMEAITKFARNYPKSFEPHFSDVVDICIGWHLEVEQENKIKYECSRLLQALSKFWLKDLKFTIKLLGQFMEDIESCNLELETHEILNATTAPEVTLGSFISAYNTVLKCIAVTPNNLELILTNNNQIPEDLSKILTIARQAVQQSSDENAVIPINEFMYLLLSCQDVLQLDISFYENIILEEVKQLKQYTESTIMSFISIVIRFIETIKNDLSLNLIQEILNNDSNVMKLRFRGNRRYFVGIATIFHQILDIKNVSVLQEAYQHILTDFQKCFDTFTTDQGE